jgi:O-antigen/teichoic acid export membrane protein
MEPELPVTTDEPGPQAARTLAARLSGIAALAGYVRLKPFDTSTDEGRARERYRRAALTALATASGKGVSIVCSLVSIPLALRYLGNERYGMWMIISTMSTFLQFADLGMGNGLVNAISNAHGRNDTRMAQQYVSTTFFLLVLVMLVLLVAFGCAYPFARWGAVFNVTDSLAAREAGPSVVAYFLCLALNMPLDVVQRVQNGYQEGFISSLWQGLGSVLALGGLLVATWLRGGLPWLVLAMVGGPLVATGLGWGTEFWFRRPWLLPARRHFSRDAARTMRASGTLFALQSIAWAVAYATDNVVTARVLGAGAVADYAVPMRLFALLSLVLSMVVAPLWPAYGEAVARGDAAWIRRTLRRSVWGTLGICVPFVGFLVLGGRLVLRLWLGTAVSPSYPLLAGLGLWCIGNNVVYALMIFLNGVNRIRFQVLCALVTAAAAVGLKTLLARLLGLPGVAWGTVVAVALFFILPVGLYIPRLLRQIEGWGVRAQGGPSS